MESTSSGDNDPNANNGPQILGAILATWAVALAVLILRFVARRISNVALWADDWLIFHSGVIGCFVASVVVGAGRHTQVLTSAQYSKVEVLFLSGELVFNFAVNLPKLSILAFYWRIFSVSPEIKRPVQIVGVIVILWTLISIFILIFQCSPPSKLAHPEYPGHCLSKWGIFVGGSIPNLVLDVVILLMPIPFIWKLQVGPRKKIYLSILFSLGGLACVTSALRLWAFATRNYQSTDLTWTATDPIIWSCTEAALAIIAACVLSLRPILTYIRTGSATPTDTAARSFSRARLKDSTGTSSSRRRWFSSDRTNTTSNSMTRTTMTEKSLDATAIPMALRDDRQNFTALPSLGPEPLSRTEPRPLSFTRPNSFGRIAPGTFSSIRPEFLPSVEPRNLPSIRAESPISLGPDTHPSTPETPPRRPGDHSGTFYVD